MTWKVDSVEYVNERAISTQAVFFVCRPGPLMAPESLAACSGSGSTTHTTPSTPDVLQHHHDAPAYSEKGSMWVVG
jgi:hypothetical protein